MNKSIGMGNRHVILSYLNNNIQVQWRCKMIFVSVTKFADILGEWARVLKN